MATPETPETTEEMAGSVRERGGPREAVYQPLDVEPRWVGYREARDMFGLSKWTWLKLADEGYIRSCHVGRKRLLEVQSIELYLNERVAKESAAE